MFPWQILPWQLESVLDVPRNLPLKFHQNRVSNSWDIADIEFLWGGGGVVHSHFIVKPNLVLRLGWGFDNKSVHNSESITIIVLQWVYNTKCIIMSVEHWVYSHLIILMVLKYNFKSFSLELIALNT